MIDVANHSLLFHLGRGRRRDWNQSGKMSLCSGCSEDYFSCIGQFYKKDQECLEFLRNHGVLPSEVKCVKCGRACVYREDDHEWRCSQYYCPKNKKKGDNVDDDSQ